MAHYITSNDCLFIHIPKTGGTSVLRWIQDNLEHEKRGEKHWDYKTYKTRYGHPTNHFTVVRNPYARLLSWFHYMGEQARWRLSQNTPEVWDQAAWRAYKRGFKVWVKESKNVPSSMIWSKNILQNQVDWYKEKSINFVLKTESLDKDFIQIQEWYNCFAPLPHANKSANSSLNYRNEYDYEMKLVVQKYFEKDLDTFKYVF